MGHSKFPRRRFLRGGALLGAGAALGYQWMNQPGGAGALLRAASAASMTPVKGGTLKVAQVGDPPTLDIMASTADVVTNDTQGIFEGFFALDASGNPQPVLATGAQWSNGNLTLTLPLRSGVLFHNGSPMTAADAAASLQRWPKPAPLGQSTASAVQQIAANDPPTVVVELNLYPQAREKDGMDAAVEALRNDTEVHGEGDDAFSITVRSRDSALAAKTANRLAELFIEGNLQVRAGQVARTRDVIAQQLAQMRCATRGVLRQHQLPRFQCGHRDDIWGS